VIFEDVTDLLNSLARNFLSVARGKREEKVEQADPRLKKQGEG
jgi:hypothetical protein